MARPETHADLPAEAQNERLALFDLYKFKNRPRLLRAYTDFIECVQNGGGLVEDTHGGVAVYRPKTKAELDAAVASRQSTWDYAQETYEKALRDEEMPDYLRKCAVRHAQAEGLPAPYAADHEVEV